MSPGRSRLPRYLAAQARNALLRPGADATYADGDDASWQAIDWGPMQRTVVTPTGPVNLVDTNPDGGESALIWIHGLSGRWQNWLLNLPAFMDRHRCIALDLPGFGGSPMPADRLISITRYAEVVDRVCSAIGVERGTIIGNSMGGFIGAEIALRFATRVEKLVLVSAAGLSLQYQLRQPLVLSARLAEIAGAQRAAADLRLAINRPRARRLAFMGIMRYPERVSAALLAQQVQDALPGFVKALDALMSYSFRERLQEISVPVLVVWGQNDMLVPVGDAQRFVDLIGPNARKVVFEDTGHVPMLERPSRFNATLEAFLAGDPAPHEDVAGVHG